MNEAYLGQKKNNLLKKIRRDPCWDGYDTDPRRKSCTTSKMMGKELIAQQHYLPSERKGLLQHTVNIKVSQH